MIYYEVQVELEHHLAEAFHRYMCDKHIPEIWATGCFETIHFDQQTPTYFRTVYAAATKTQLEHYLSNYTQHFRADFQAHFPEGVTATRSVWSEIAHWDHHGVHTEPRA